jgi:alanine racemase
VESKKSVGPVGYGAFAATHHGVIRAGYSNGLRIGPCLINGRSARILEVGMQTAYVETIEADKIGDEVVLLGDTIDLSDVARAWKTGPHEVLTRMCAIGIREYI